MYRKWLFISILYAFIRYTFKCNLHQPQLKLNPLNLANCDLVFGPVVKFGGPGRLMRSHLLGMLEPASILQVNRHPSCAPSVAPDPRQKPRVRARLRMAAQALCRLSARPLSAVPALFTL